MKPNIVVIMTDQHRADFSKIAGFPLDTTPFLDGMAAKGTYFRHAYTSYPACVPARTSLLTGRFPVAHRVTQNSNPAHAYYSHDLLDVLRGAGYRLFFSGKPHMHPEPADFDAYAGPYFHTAGPHERAGDATFDAWLERLDHGVAHEPTPFPLEHQLPHRIVTDALEQVGSRTDDKPVFLWISFPEPHNPYQVPEPYFSMFDEAEVPAPATGAEVARTRGGHWQWLQTLIEEKRPGYEAEWRRYRANYCGMLRLIDDQVKRLVEHVDTELPGETIYVFLSDHGDYVGEYGLQRKGAGMPECLMRIPMFFSGSAVVAEQVRPELVSIVDVFPTLCELVGQALPPGVQGRSLAPLLAGAGADTDEFDSLYAERGYGGLTYGVDERPPLHFPYAGPSFDELNAVTQSGRTKMLRFRDYKLLIHSTGQGELFDLNADPDETKNLFDDRSLTAVRDQMIWLLLQWMLRLQDDLPEGVYTPKTADRNWVGIEASPTATPGR